VIDIPADFVNRLVEYVRVHSEDVDVIAPVCMCLAKLAEHPLNASHIIASPIVGYLANLLKNFMHDPRAVEAIISLIRPLSVDMEVLDFPYFAALWVCSTCSLRSAVAVLSRNQAPECYSICCSSDGVVP
jgi:hypothetical protein